MERQKLKQGEKIRYGREVRIITSVNEMRAVVCLVGKDGEALNLSGLCISPYSEVERVS